MKLQGQLCDANADDRGDYKYLFLYLCFSIRKWATSWEKLFLLYVNNKGADQPAHPRRTINSS